MVVAVLVIILLAILNARPRTLVAVPGNGISWGSFTLHEERNGLRWNDGWRSGSIDERARTIRLPGSWSERPLGEFYRVAVTTRELGGDDYDRTRSDAGVLIDLVAGVAGQPVRRPAHGRVYRYTFAVVDRHAREHVLFELEERPQEDGAQQVIGRIRERVERALGVPDRLGIGLPLHHPPKADESPAASGPRMRCPNCHASHPLYLTTCPKCHVALFKD
jgi:hypothetical protein